LGNGNFFILAGIVDGIGQQVIKGLGDAGFIGYEIDLLVGDKFDGIAFHFH
jgi:hypothetical protein